MWVNDAIRKGILLCAVGLRKAAVRCEGQKVTAFSADSECGAISSRQWDAKRRGLVTREAAEAPKALVPKEGPVA